VQELKRAEENAAENEEDPYEGYAFYEDGTYTPDYLVNAGEGEIADVSQYENGDSVMAEYERYMAKKEAEAYTNSDRQDEILDRQVKNLTRRGGGAFSAPGTMGGSMPGSMSMPESRPKKNLPPPFTIDVISVDGKDYPNEVRIKCTVRDYMNTYVAGLAPPYCKGDYKKHWEFVLDSCAEEIPVSELEVTEVRASTSPDYNISFVLDFSGSMGSKTEKLMQATTEAVEMVKDKDWLSVIKYHTDVLPEILPTNNRDSALAILRDTTRKTELGGTQTYKAVDSTISLMKSAPENLSRVMILFTDGSSADYSKSKLDLLYGKILDEDVTIYTIAYGYAETTPMIRLAELTDGRFYHVMSSQEFPYVFKDIMANLNNHYLISYKPPVSGGIHKATVNLDVIGDDKIVIQDSGYYDCSLFGNYARIGSKIFMNIEFETGSSEVLPESKKELKKIADEMKLKPKLVLEVAGHTDDVGSNEDNLALSVRRAEAVRAVLIGMGVKSSRLVPKGYGEEKPLEENDSEANRKKNRRTEFIVLENR
jgi:outer membrane protein OmpA-like peptidoglycan-associated protein